MAEASANSLAVTIGTHPAEFKTYLESAGYTVNSFDTYTEYTQSAPVSPTVLAAYGEDDALDSSESILNLLNADVVLMFFAPSEQLLETVKSVAKTVLDLPQMKFAEGVPLVVYKIQGLDHYHLTPGFTVQALSSDDVQDDVTKLPPLGKTPRKDKPPAPLSRLLQQAVKVIGSSITHASDAAVQAELRAGTDTLDPPTGTSFVSSTSFTFSGSWYMDELPWINGANVWTAVPENQVQYWDLNWIIYLYTYATNHSPNPNSEFASNGGIVYTVARYGGNLQRSRAPRWFGPWNGEGNSEAECYFIDMFVTEVAETTGLLQTFMQTPQSGNQSGTSFSYDVDFAKQLNLFRDNGKTPFQYQVAYSESYTRDQMMQVSLQPDSQTYQFVEAYKNYYDRWGGGLSNESWWNHGVFDWSDGDYKTCKVLPRDDIPIRGLSVWSSNVGRANLSLGSGCEPIGFKSNTAWGYGHFTYAPLWGEMYEDFPLDLTFGG